MANTDRPLLVPFKSAHAIGLINRDGRSGMNLQSLIEKELGGPAYTVMLGDRVLGCCGMVVPWPGVGIGWAFFTQELFKYPLWATRTTRRVMMDLVRVFGIHRLEAVVLSDNPKNQGWIETLGFKRENGCARSYTPDRRSVTRYEWIKEDYVG